MGTAMSLQKGHDDWSPSQPIDLCGCGYTATKCLLGLMTKTHHDCIKVITETKKSSLH
jgi:hypothetical protein